MIEPPSSQRSATRAPIDRPIRLQFDDSLDVDDGQCINISIGGMFVHTGAPRPPGTLVRFELPLSDDRSIRGLGEVVWQQRATAPSMGVGIKFRFLEQRDRQQIFKLVSQHIKARLERESEPRQRPGDEVEPAAPESRAFAPSDASGEIIETVAIDTSSIREDAFEDDVETISTSGPSADFADEIHADETLRIDPALLESPGEPPAPSAAEPPARETPGRGIPARETPAPENPTPENPTPENPAPEIPTPDIPAPETSAAASGPATAEASLFERWHAPEDAVDASHAADPDAGAAVDADAPGGFDARFAEDPDPGTSETLAPLPDVRPRRPRRRRDRSWLIAVLLTVAVAAGAAYLLRDRLFTGLVSVDESGVVDEGGIDEGALPRAGSGTGTDTGTGTATGAGGTDPGDGGDSASARGVRPPGSGDASDRSAGSGTARTPRSAAPRSAVSPPATSQAPPSQVPPSQAPPSQASPVSASSSSPTRGSSPPSPSSDSPSRGLDVPAEPLPASPPPTVRRPADAQAATRLDDIRWQRRGDNLVVTLALDGTLGEGRLRRFRLGGATPREVVVLVGMSGPYRQSQIPVGEGPLSGVRTGFHRKTRGDEIHVVLDLAAADDAISDVRNLGDRIEIVVGDR